MSEQRYSELLRQIESKARGSVDLHSLYNEVVTVLRMIPYYNWVGFYLLSDGILVLGPYQGKPTQHVRIKVGQGICGRAVAEKSTIVVDDVAKESNYLACSLETKSEIAVPIWANEEIVGEIDIDSDDMGAFSEEDRHFLEQVAEIVGTRVEQENRKSERQDR